MNNVSSVNKQDKIPMTFELMWSLLKKEEKQYLSQCRKNKLLSIYKLTALNNYFPTLCLNALLKGKRGLFAVPYRLISEGKERNYTSKEKKISAFPRTTVNRMSALFVLSHKQICLSACHLAVKEPKSQRYFIVRVKGGKLSIASFWKIITIKRFFTKLLI